MNGLLLKTLHLPSALEPMVDSASRHRGQSAIVMGIIYAIIAVFAFQLWWVYDLSSTWHALASWLDQRGSEDMPAWGISLIQAFGWLLAFVPSLFQWGLADKQLQRHPALAWPFLLTVGFDLATDAPKVVADVDTWLMPLIGFMGEWQWVGQYALYILALYAASLTLQTLFTTFMVGAMICLFGDRRGRRKRDRVVEVLDDE